MRVPAVWRRLRREPNQLLGLERIQIQEEARLEEAQLEEAQLEEARLAAMQEEGKREKILQALEGQRRVESEMAGKEVGERKENADKLAELVLGEPNMQQLFFMLRRTARNVCKGEEPVLKSMALRLKATMKTEKSRREPMKLHL